MGFEDLDAWFTRARGEYAQRKRDAEAAVVRWEWATGAVHELQPFSFERNRFSRGKPLKAPPEFPAEGDRAYGFDGEGRLRVERSHSGFVRDGASWCYETFFEHLPGRVDAVAYHHHPDKEVVSVRRARWEEGRLAVLAMHGMLGGSVERYAYDGARLARIAAEGERWDPPLPWRRLDTLHYDADGTLVRIDREEAGAVHTLFRRREKGETFASLAAKVEERLLTLIPERVSALGLTEPAYVLVLAYDGEGNDLFPPAVGVGLERERAAVLSERLEDARHRLWNPAEFSWYERGPLVLDDAALEAACERLNAHVHREDAWDEARALLVRVAKRLLKLDWARRLPVTDDFLVLATDYEQTDLKANVRAIAGVKRTARLERDGLLP